MPSNLFGELKKHLMIASHIDSGKRSPQDQLKADALIIGSGEPFIWIQNSRRYAWRDSRLSDPRSFRKSRRRKPGERMEAHNRQPWNLPGIVESSLLKSVRRPNG
jgi:hypothetical protein